MPSADLVERYFYLFVVVVGNAGLLVDPADLRRYELRVVALARDLEVYV